MNKLKTRIRIHNPCNERTRHFRYYNLFWDRLTDVLSQRFHVHEHRYLEISNGPFMNVELRSVNTATWPMGILECDYIIENLENDEFCILSVSDVFHLHHAREQNNPKLKKVLFAGWQDFSIEGNIKPENRHKYSPWIYFQSNCIDLDTFYYKRKYLKTEMSDKLLFRGNIGDRPIIEHFSPDILNGPEKTGENSYFDELLQHKIALSVGGVSEICYRDMEYLALGIPFIRFEYTHRMKEPLIPNVHYISVPRPDDLPENMDRLGLPKHAEMLQQRYLEVINDKDFLEFVSVNARNYYTSYIQYPNDVNNTFTYLELQDWESGEL